MLYHILARFNLQFINLLHIIILVAWQAWHINSKMNQPPNYQEMGFFPFHIYKNLPRITVFRKLKCPDPSMIPLPAEVKECLQKSIRLTSNRPFNQLICCISVSSYMLTRRFAVHLNRSLVGLLGIVIEKTDVAYLRSFPCVVVKKDISSYLRRSRNWSWSYFVASRHLRDAKRYRWFYNLPHS